MTVTAVQALYGSPPAAVGFPADKATVATQLIELSADRRLADRSAPLMNLATDVMSDEASAWADVNLVGTLGMPTAGPMADSTLVRRLDRTRTVLLFLPVLVTWLGLFLAGFGYRSLLQEDPEARYEPFLKLWFSGFRGHSPIGLDVLAGITVAIVLAIVVVSVLADTRRDRDEREQSRASNQLDRRLHTALLGATLVLARGRANAPELVRQAMRETAAELGHVVDRARTAAEVVTASFNHLESVAERIEAGVDRSGDAADTIASAADRATTSIRGLVDGVTAAVASVTTATGLSLRSLETVVAGASDSVRQSSTDAISSMSDANVKAMAALEKAMTDATHQAEKSIGGAVADANRSSAAMAKIVGDAGASVAGLQDLVRSTGDGLEQRMAEGSAVLIDAVTGWREGMSDALAVAAEQITSGTSDLVSHVEASSHTVIAAVEATLSKSDQALDRVEKTFDRVGQAVDAVHGRLDSVLDQGLRGADLVRAHTEAAKTLAALDTTIAGARDTWSHAVGRFEATRQSDDDRRAGQDEKQHQVVAELSSVSGALHRLAVAHQGHDGELQRVGAETATRLDAMGTTLERIAASLDRTPPPANNWITGGSW